MKEKILKEGLQSFAAGGIVASQHDAGRDLLDRQQYSVGKAVTMLPRLLTKAKAKLKPTKSRDVRIPGFDAVPAYRGASDLPVTRNRIAKELEDAGIGGEFGIPLDEITNEDLKSFSNEGRRLVNALKKDDWLGFDTIDDLMLMIFDENIEEFGPSLATKSALGRYVNLNYGDDVAELKIKKPTKDKPKIKKPKTDLVADWNWDDLYTEANGIFFRGESKSGSGINTGVMGRGKYVTWEKSWADDFAAHHEDGIVRQYKIKKGLKIADYRGKDIDKIKKDLFNMEPWDDKGSDPLYTKLLTLELERLGYDGVLSDSAIDCLVIFNEKNISLVSKKPKTKKAQGGLLAREDYAL